MGYIGNKIHTFVACQRLTNHRSYLLPHILQSNRDLKDNVHGGRGYKVINSIGGWLNAKWSQDYSTIKIIPIIWQDKEVKKQPSIPPQLGLYCYPWPQKGKASPGGLWASYTFHVSERYEQTLNLYLNVLWEKRSGSRYPCVCVGGIQPLRDAMDRETIKGFFLKRTKLILSGYDRNLSQWLIMGWY